MLVFRPQEAVAAVAALDQAYRDYYAAVADPNRAQFRLYRALGHPAQGLTNVRRPAGRAAGDSAGEAAGRIPRSPRTASDRRSGTGTHRRPVHPRRSVLNRPGGRPASAPVRISRRVPCRGFDPPRRNRVRFAHPDPSASGAPMNPISAALRRPITVMVLIAGTAFAGLLAVSRMKVDIFPPLNLPVIYVCQPYGGMDPQQMEGLIANYYEYHFLYINGIHHVESKNTQGVSLMKLYFHPGTDMAQAMAETVGYVNRSRAFMPPGHRQPVHHAVRHRQRAGRLPGAVERDEDDRPDPGPGAVQGPADVRRHRGRVAPRRRSAAASGRSSSGPTRTGCGPTALSADEVVQGPDRRQHHRPVRADPRSQDADAAGADQRDGGPAGGAGRPSR